MTSLSDGLKARLLLGVVSMTTFSFLACGAETGNAVRDSATSLDAGGDTLAVTFADTMPADTMPPIPDASPSENVTASEAFGAIAANYDATTANVTGGGQTDFDNGVKTTFTVVADGKVTFNTKGGVLLFDWAVHGRTIKRNSKTGVTNIEMEGPGGRLINLTAAPGIGLFDVSTVTFNPDGRWYLTAITRR
jgi:hypothetical protein